MLGRYFVKANLTLAYDWEFQMILASSPTRKEFGLAVGGQRSETPPIVAPWFKESLLVDIMISNSSQHGLRSPEIIS
jgi:hypothetical protein